MNPKDKFDLFDLVSDPAFFVWGNNFSFEQTKKT